MTTPLPPLLVNNNNNSYLSTKSIPSEVLSVIESYLPPSSCANLSASCHFFRSRWTSIRWFHTFKYHYGPKRIKESTPREHTKNRYYYAIDDSTISSTQFNVSALIPSVTKAYTRLCETLELAMLGFYDRRYTAFTNEDNALPDINIMQAFYFFIAFKPLEILFRTSNSSIRKSSSTTNYNPFHMVTMWRSSHTLTAATSSISAWKLACLLKEKGMDCIRCSLCDQIDLLEDLWRTAPSSMMSSSEEEFGDTAWCSPCSCQDLVHRTCLENQLRLGLMPRLPGLPSQAGRMWISYDDPSPELRRTDVAAVDRNNRFVAPHAKCNSCAEQYRRAIRLPRSTNEVLFASLADPLSLLRAFSTFVHFCLCCVFIAAVEGMCTDEHFCGNHHVLVITPFTYHFVFKWPLGKHALVLAWWQLQQCCMLHIFFSPRFVAIVDRLSLGPISYFYCKMYLYFLITSSLLAATFLPSVSRVIMKNIIFPTMSPLFVEQLGPIVAFITYLNLAQYAVVSSIVICIFWRTNYRVFTVADSRDHPNNVLWRQGRRRSNWTHPIYYGHWQSLR